jgi:hypothetical protein
MDKVTQALQDSLLRFWSAGAAAARNHKEASPKAFENEARRLARIAYAPDRITPEVVEAAARGIAKEHRIEICSDAQYRHSTFGPKAEAAIRAAFAVLRCA